MGSPSNQAQDSRARLLSFVPDATQGKDKPTYAPHEDSGDVVVVVNARHTEFTGRKLDKKLYRWHTGCAKGLLGRSTAETLVGACGVKSFQ